MENFTAFNFHETFSLNFVNFLDVFERLLLENHRLALETLHAVDKFITSFGMHYHVRVLAG